MTFSEERIAEIIGYECAANKINPFTIDQIIWAAARKIKEEINEHITCKQCAYNYIRSLSQLSTPIANVSQSDSGSNRTSDTPKGDWSDDDKVRCSHGIVMSYYEWKKHRKDTKCMGCFNLEHDSLSQPGTTVPVFKQGKQQHGVLAGELSKRNVDSLERGNNQESQDVKHAPCKGESVAPETAPCVCVRLNGLCVVPKCGCSCHKKSPETCVVECDNCTEFFVAGKPCDKSCECHKKEEQK